MIIYIYVLFLYMQCGKSFNMKYHTQIKHSQYIGFINILGSQNPHAVQLLVLTACHFQIRTQD